MPDSAGQLVLLDALLETGPVIVSLNRGHWCPYCRLELRALARAAPYFAQRRAQIVSIVPEPAELTGLLVEKQSLPFKALSDMDLAYTSTLNLVVAVNAEVVAIYRELGIDLPRFQAREGWLLPIPATFVVGTDRKIRAAFVDPEFRRRMTIEQIEAALDD